MSTALEVIVTVTDPTTHKNLIVSGDLNVLRELLAGVKISLPKQDEVYEVDLNDFISDMKLTVNLLDPKCRTQSQDLYDLYVTWCEKNNNRPLSSTRMANEWRKLGFEKIIINGLKYWLGVKL